MKFSAFEIEGSFHSRGAGIQPQDPTERSLRNLARVALEETSRLACILTTSGLLLECDRAAMAAFGAAADMVIGKPVWELFRQSCKSQGRDALRDAVALAADGEIVSRECEPFESNNRREPAILDFTVRPIRDASNAVVLLLLEARIAEGSSASRDDELNEANRKLREANAQFQAIWEQGLFAGRLDLNGVVVDVNRACVEGCGFTRLEILGKPFWECGWWNRAPDVQEWVRRAVEQAIAGEPFRGESRYFLADGSERVVDFACMPIKDASGRVVFVIPTGMDVTEGIAGERTRRAYESERQRADSLVKLDELETQFFANFSHELRTPLTLLLGPLEDLLGKAHGALLPAAEANLRIAHRNALRLLKLVNSMLDFYRLKSGHVQPCYQPTDLPALTAELAGDFSSLCESAGLKLIVNCASFPSGEPTYVDRELWEKVVLNLLSNAVKFTLQGEIELRLESGGGNACLTIRDTGIGIPSEALPHVFERFRHIENRGRTHEGAGIGLALVHEFVKVQGGTITVESALDQGTTIKVTLPVDKARLHPDDAAGTPASLSAVTPDAFVEEALCWFPEEPSGEAQPSHTGEHAPGAERKSAKPRILYADDNSDMRAYVSRLLGQRFEVQTVSDGEAALAAARAHPPDLLLSDVMMPKLDGFGLLRAWRSDPQLRDTPIILLSARAGEESRIEGITSGADDYLIKPFSARELFARVDTHIKVSRMRQQANAAMRESEERFRNFANTAPAILWLTGPDSACSFVSRGWHDYTGQDEESALGFGWIAAVHPEDRENAKRLILEATASRTDFTLDFRLRRTDGQYRWALSSGRPRFNPDGTFAGFIGSVIDIHERKQSAEASAFLSAIVDSSDDAIVGKDLNGIIKSWNKGAERLFGYSVAEAVGKSIMILIPPDRQDEEPKILERLRRGERVDHFETVRVRKDGTLLNISLTISPIKGSDGKIVGASKIARDITARVRQEEALKQANAALKQANADLQQFAYSASHDLQEPLRMVAAYSELLQARFGGKLGPVADEYIGYTVQGATRMENLLRDLRAYTQLTTTENEPVDEIDAGEVLKKTLLNLDVTIREAGAAITSAALPRVRIQAFQLEQLFQNLIGNALRYRSNLPPRIHIEAVLRDSQWIFSVQDNGIGIDPKYKELIFGIFKRLHSAAEYPGTGMGLAICQRIVERAGGRIWVESEPGRGSTFYFTIPTRRLAHRPASQDLLDSPDRGQPGGCGIGAGGS